MKRLKILVGCERSGIVREAFRRRGHMAVSCDLEPAEDGGPHIVGDIMDVIREPWSLVILHPECRAVCFSGNKHYGTGKPKNEKRLAAAAWIQKLWNTAKEYSISVALENSRGVLPRLTELGPPTQTIQPYQFGHDASKTTDLWLFNLDPLPLNPDLFIKPRIEFNDQGRPYMRWSNQALSGADRKPPSKSRSMDRARTFQGIADAFAETWG